MRTNLLTPSPLLLVEGDGIAMDSGVLFTVAPLRLDEPAAATPPDAAAVAAVAVAPAVCEVLASYRVVPPVACDGWAK